MQKAQTRESFWLRVDKSGGEDACWEWQGHRLALGYGQVSWQGKLMSTHRLAYLLTHGTLPEGKQIHHKCNNRACCNPCHLEVVTARANILLSNGNAARNARKANCAHGHTYTPENTYINSHGARECRACRRERVKGQTQRPVRIENRIW